MNCAPIFIPTLNRDKHFIACVESLKKNFLAAQTILYIGLDYPPSERYRPGWVKINEYVDSLEGFKEIVVLRRARNYGAVANMLDGINQVFEKHDRVIFSEDDNTFSMNFLEFMDEALERYQDNDNVYVVSGFSDLGLRCPENVPESNYYLSHRFSAWGFACWKKKYEIHAEKCKNFFDTASVRELWRLFCGTPYLVRMQLFLRACSKRSDDTWIESYLHATDRYCVYALASKVQNWGHDGSGLNCGKQNFVNPELDQQLRFTLGKPLPQPLVASAERRFENARGGTWKQRFRIFCGMAAYKIGLKKILFKNCQAKKGSR